MRETNMIQRDKYHTPNLQSTEMASLGRGKFCKITSTRSKMAKKLRRCREEFGCFCLERYPIQTSLVAVILYTILILVTTTNANAQSIAPTIDYSHNMRVLKLPKSTPIGSLIYRLKGSDPDPETQLSFGVSGIEGRALLDIVPVSHSWNEADVFLRSALERNQYNLTIFVSDGNKTTQIESTILAIDEIDLTAQQANDGDTNLSPFVNAKHVFHVPENAMPDEPIGFVTVLESQKSDLPVRFELRGKGADKFSIKYVFGPKGQSKADIVLAQRVDYEKQNLFNLKVLALNAWSNARLDTRNIATMDIVITVGDVQDTAPVFKNLPQSVKLVNTLNVGDQVAKIEAEDGDYADQRPVAFALDAASPLSSYFDIDKQTGEISLLRPIKELIMHAAWGSATWSVLTVFASEVPDTSSYDHLWPPMYAKAELPLLLIDIVNEAPQFVGGWQTADTRLGMKILHGYLNEASQNNDNNLAVRWFTNSSMEHSSESLATMAAIEELTKSLGGRPTVLDLGLGANGTFELSIEGPDAHLFELDPIFPITRQTAFTLTVNNKDPFNKSLFDHDLLVKSTDENRRSFTLDIVARDFGSPQRQSSKVRCLIELIDVNDNSPQFETDLYSFSIYENSQPGQQVGNVRARDPDSGLGGRVRYTSLMGKESHLFRLDQDSGQLTLEGHLDREKKSSYLFLVEARDSSGIGTSNYTQLMINVLDVNDNAPVFLQSHYDAVLLADGTFHQPLVVQALDADELGTANSQVAYEIIAGNQNDQFSIDSLSGAIYPSNSLQQPSDGNSNKQQANVLPQIPPILAEPIVPFNGANNLAGKILPTSGGHEIEETTFPSRNSRQNYTTADSHTVQYNSGTIGHNRFGWPRSTDGLDIASESINRTLEGSQQVVVSGNETNNSLGARGRGGHLPPMDIEQLPALDLLLNLESEPSTVRIQPRHLTSSLAQSYSSNFGQTMKVPPITTLVVRAHDFGIPLRSSTVRVNIYNQALLSRSVSLILNGTYEQLEQRRESIERAFSAITGSKATIESIDGLSESSSLSVARVKLAVPQHSLVDLTDLSSLMAAIDYHPIQHEQARHPVTHYITNDRIVPSTNTMSSNITGHNNSQQDIHSYAIDPTLGIERRLLIYIIIVGVCILALLVVWMIYSCSREDQVKIIEKSSMRRNDRQVAGNYRRHLGKEIDSDESITKMTHAKTAQNSMDSPIGNQLAKSQKGTQVNSFLPVPTTTTTRAVKSDHQSMYNGQVWFEPANSAKPPTLLTGRRASSAPSATSLDSALHSIMNGRNSALSRSRVNQQNGQFFPNTIGYMENLASMDPNGSYGGFNNKGLSKRHRKRKVVPLPVGGGSTIGQRAPSKPPRMVMRETGYTNEAFSNDLEAGGEMRPQSYRQQQQHRRHQADDGESCSQSGSSLGGSIVLDSDQELLGFDPTGTPIIATHTRRAASVRPLIVDLLEQPSLVPATVANKPTALVASSAATIASKAASGSASTSAATATDLPAREKSPPEVDKIKRIELKGLPATELNGTRENSATLQRRANSQGDLMSELNKRLNDRRKHSADQPSELPNLVNNNNDEISQIKPEAKLVETATTTTSALGKRAKLERRPVQSAGSGDSQSVTRGEEERNDLLSNMKNGELLERQSIFALTYSGLATDKPPA